jgi:transposase
MRTLSVSRKVGTFWSYVLVILVCSIFFAPFLYLVSTALKSSQQVIRYPRTLFVRPFHGENFLTIFSMYPVAMYFKNTILVVIGSIGVYDTRERIWRHLNFFQYRCYVKARVPRVTDGQGKVRTVSVPWGRSGSGFTLLMEGVILSLVKHMPVRAVAQEIGEHDTRLWRVVEHHVRTALDGQDFSDVRAIGCDEYSHKGHNYITVFLSHPDVKLDEEGRRSQVGRGRVLFVTEGKDKAAVGRFLKRFEQKDGEPEDVTVATSDMIHGFRSAMTEAFPNAVMTVDKFHVVMNCSKAVDDTRRREMHSREKGKTTALKKSRYLWLSVPSLVI